MRVREAMTKNPASIGPQAPIVDIAKFLLVHGISAAPVVGEGGELLGVVSEADLVHREELGTLKRRAWWLSVLTEVFTDSDDRARAFIKSHGWVAGDVMTRGAIAVHPDADIADAAALMDDKRIKRVFVTEGGALVGVVTRADLVRVLARQVAKSTPARSDSAIRDELQRQIRETDWAPCVWVTITVHHGVVELSGGIESDVQREGLVVLARGIPGVRRVNEHLVKRRVPSMTVY